MPIEKKQPFLRQCALVFALGLISGPLSVHAAAPAPEAEDNAMEDNVVDTLASYIISPEAQELLITKKSDYNGLSMHPESAAIFNRNKLAFLRALDGKYRAGDPAIDHALDPLRAKIRPCFNTNHGYHSDEESREDMRLVCNPELAFRYIVATVTPDELATGLIQEALLYLAEDIIMHEKMSLEGLPAEAGGGAGAGGDDD